MVDIGGKVTMKTELKIETDANAADIKVDRFEPLQFTTTTTLITTIRKRCGERQQYIPRYIRGRK